MNKCTKCGYSYEGEVCPACGARKEERPAPKPAPEKKSAPSGETAIRSNPLFKKYADFLDDAALFNMACCLAEGVGVARNKAQAAEMFQILAFRGHYPGMYKLAEHYLSLDPPDRESAVQWLRIAADGGHEPSLIRLQVLGEKVTRNAAMQMPGGSFEARVREALPSIVMIYSTFQRGNRSVSSCGSGFVIEGGYVITNAHVVGSDPKSVTASFEPSVDERSYNLMPLAVASEYDVAVLRFTGLADKRISERGNLRLRTQDVQYGEEVYTIGNPLGLRFSVSRGVVSTPHRQHGHRDGVHEVIQTDITANHGNSGGALLDVNNDVLGMITYTPGDSEGGISMCVPSKYIVQVLNKVSSVFENRTSR